MRLGKKAFTLVEIMVSMTVAMFAMAGIMMLLVKVLNIHAYEQGRLMLNTDVRKMTQQMTRDAVDSSYFRVYTSFTNRSDNGSYDGTTDSPVSDGGTGDFMLLVTQSTDSQGVPRITRLVAYYRDALAPYSVGNTLVSLPGPVRRRQVDLASPGLDARSTSLLALMNAQLPVSGQSTNPALVRLAQGLGNGCLFCNSHNRSVVVRGQVQEQGNLLYTRTANTYNLTLSPRG
jgi:hypothetical protein